MSTVDFSNYVVYLCAVEYYKLSAIMDIFVYSIEQPQLSCEYSLKLKLNYIHIHILTYNRHKYHKYLILTYVNAHNL